MTTRNRIKRKEIREYEKFGKCAFSHVSFSPHKMVDVVLEVELKQKHRSWWCLFFPLL